MMNLEKIPLLERRAGIRAVSLTGMPASCTDPENALKWKCAFRRMAVIPEQTHSLNVGVIEKDDDWKSMVFPATDALVSFNPEVAVGVLTADCVPILLHAPDIRAVAAIHAGWKGTLGGILDHTVALLCERGADPKNMTAIFGPSISAPVYEVSPDMAEEFAGAGFADCVSYPGGAGSRPHLDLQGANALRLVRLGLDEGRIVRSNFCTFSSTTPGGAPLFPSYRRDKTPLRLLSMIGAGGLPATGGHSQGMRIRPGRERRVRR